MPRTIQEIKAQLAADGYQGEPTNEILLEAGWEPDDVLKDIVPTPAVSPDALKADLARLQAEAQAGALPVEIGASILRIIGIVKAAGLI